MIAKTHTRSFAGGEIAPELYGRIDLTKFQTGLAKSENFWILPHGPAQNRPGFQFVNEAKDSTRAVRLIPFAYSTEQTFAIEFGHQYIRWHTNGGTLLETGLAITGITQASPGVLSYTGTDPSNGDWMYLSGIGGMTALNGRYVKVANVNGGANTFELTDLWGANIDTSAMGAFTAGGTAARVYTLTTTYTESELFDIHFVQSADVLTLVHPSHPVRELRRVSATNWTLTAPTFAPGIAAPGAPTATAGGPGGGTPVTYYYKTTALATDTLEESLASASANASRDLSVAGNYIDVTPAAVAGAVRYNVYKLSNGLYGYIGQTDGSAFRDSNVTADVSQTPPEANAPFGSADNYPGAVGYFEGRRVFAGTNNKPQKYWLTKSASESNLSYSIPSRDDDSIQGNILARQVNRLRHIVALDSLIMLTSGQPWKIAPQNSDILTPTSALPKPVLGIGASNVQPIVTASSLIYVTSTGSRIAEMRYKWEAQNYTVSDASIMAPHLFKGYTLADAAYTEEPHQIGWFVRSDGTLLGMTHVPDHEVLAWHRHATTGGTFESVCAVKEGTEFPLYAVVKRNVNGRDVRYIERLHTRRFTDAADAFIVDSGLTYDGSAVSSVSGLWHLEGKTVSILADGATHPAQTVTNGAVSLEVSASVVHVGLAITADLQGLPIGLEGASAFGQASLKNLSEVYLRVNESGGIKAGPTFSALREYPARSNEDYDSAPALKTGIVRIALDNRWSADAQICVRQSDPLPITIAALTLELAVGG